MKEKTSLVFTGDIGFDRYMYGKWDDENLISSEVGLTKLIHELSSIVSIFFTTSLFNSFLNIFIIISTPYTKYNKYIFYLYHIFW